MCLQLESCSLTLFVLHSRECQAIFLCCENQCADLILMNLNLSEHSEKFFLPVQIESILSWNEHISYACDCTCLIGLEQSFEWAQPYLEEEVGVSLEKLNPLFEKTTLVLVVMNYIHKFEQFFSQRTIPNLFHSSSSGSIVCSMLLRNHWKTGAHTMAGHPLFLRVFKKLKTHTIKFVTSPRNLKNEKEYHVLHKFLLLLVSAWF